MPNELRVKIEPFGPDQATIERIMRDLLRHASVRSLLDGTEHRLLSLRLLEPPRKVARARPWNYYRASYYDYTNNRTIAVDGRLDDRERVTVTESATQPPTTPEEFQAAVDLLHQDPEIGPALREHLLQPYAPMPPLVETELPDGRIERTVAVGLLPRDANGRARHEIVDVNLVQRRVNRHERGAPATSRADAGVCGAPVSAGQATTGQGVVGQVQVTVLQGSTVLWRFLAVRPSASSGYWGSGVELRYVDYRGRRVLYQAHVPILNVLYEEGML